MAIFGHKQEQAAEDMQKYLQQAQQQIQQGFGQAIGYMQPYYDTGTKALTDYSKTLSSWLSNPVNTYNQIMGQWSGSPAYQQETQAAIDASNAAAAASGMLGSGAQQTALQKQAEQLTAADQERFFKDITGLGKGYLQGEQGLSQMGFQSAGKMGEWSSQEAEDLAQLMQQMGIAQEQKDTAGWNLGMFAPNVSGAARGGLYSSGYLTPPRGTNVQPSITKGIVGGFLGV